MIPNWISTLWLKWKTLIHRRRLDQDLEEELSFHLAARVQKNVADGMAPHEAEAAALRQFGNSTLIRETCRELWSFVWLETLWRDLCYAARTLIKTPAFSIAAVLSLGLGIGANVAIFAIVNAVLFRTLPVPHPEQIVILENSQNGDRRPNFLSKDFLILSKNQEVLSGLFATGDVKLRQVRVASSDEPLPRVVGRLVSDNYYTVLGVGAVMGRVFSPGEQPDAVAVISYGFWQRQFGATPSVIGGSLNVNGVMVTIIGVTPPDFFGDSVGSAPDIWLPLSLQPRVAGPFVILRLMGRRAPGITDAQAEAALTAIYQHWSDSLPIIRTSRVSNIRYRIKLEPGSRGLEDMREQFSRPLWILMGVVGLILLITCCNMVSLLSARATTRRHEIGLRLALGASRRRVLRQLLVESLLIASVGGAVGIGVAAAGVPLLLALFSDPNLPYVLIDSIDLQVLAFTACISVAASLLFGLVPALRTTVVDLNLMLKGHVGQQTGILHRHRLSQGIVAVQAALSLVLLVGSSLLIHSLHSLYEVDPGFRQEGLALLKVPTAASIRLQGNKQDDLLNRLSLFPGVGSVGLSTCAPVVGPTIVREISVPGHSGGERVGVNYVSPAYFETVGTEFLQGRDFSPLDSSGSPTVAVINRTMSQRFFGKQNPVGRLISFGPSFDPKNAVQVIAVVGDAKYDGLRKPNQPFVFFSLAQETAPVFYLVIRMTGDPLSFVTTFRRGLRGIDPELAAGELSTLEQTVERTLVNEQSMTKLCVAFGLLALTLTCIGLYGTMSYRIARRVPEVGLRMALGASPGDAMWLVLREAGLLVMAGLAMGIPAALVASQLLRNLLFGLTTTDPVSYVAASLVLILVSMLATCLPARRASRVDPAVALRNQ